MWQPSSNCSIFTTWFWWPTPWARLRPYATAPDAGRSELPGLCWQRRLRHLFTKTSDNPEGVPSEIIEAQDEAIARDYPRWVAENEEPFFTPDTPQETRTWIKTMMLSISLPVALACSKTISAADLREDVRRIACPTLIVHGDKDASAPLPVTGARTARMIANSKLIVYPGAPHGLVLTHQQRFVADMLDFLA